MGLLLFTPIGGEKELEFDTISCPHCQQVKAITLKGLTKHVKYHHWCGRCKKAICKGCAKAMQQTGNCPGPFHARIDEQVRTGAPVPDNWTYKYVSTQRA